MLSEATLQEQGRPLLHKRSNLRRAAQNWQNTITMGIRAKKLITMSFLWCKSRKRIANHV